MDRETMKRNYSAICGEYLAAFCRDMEVTCEIEPWVADEAGSVACVGDLFLDFNDVIKYCVDNNLNDWDNILAWNDYGLSCAAIGLDAPNYRSWQNGCPTIPQDKLDELIKMKAELEEEIENVKSLSEY